MKNDFNVCPMCAGKNIKNLNNRKWICEDCGFDLYCNVAAAVGVIIFDDEWIYNKENENYIQTLFALLTNDNSPSLLSTILQIEFNKNLFIIIT